MDNEGDVKFSIFKLINDDEVIAKVVTSNYTQHLLYPMSIGIIRTSSNDIAIELLPYSAFSDKIKMFSDSHILYEVEPTETIINIYNQSLLDFASFFRIKDGGTLNAFELEQDMKCSTREPLTNTRH